MWLVNHLPEILFKTTCSSCRSETKEQTKSHFCPHASLSTKLISNANQVVTQLLNRFGCFARLDGVRVVGDQNRLFCFDGDNALFALVNGAYG